MNIKEIDLNLLVVFHSLMTERSVTKTASSIGLSQPAVSNALARLRSHLGDKLFVRSRRTMVPTPRASELAPEIEAALKHLRAALQPSEFSPESSKATFRLATSDEVEASLFPALMRSLQVSAPGVSVNCSRIQGLYSLPRRDLESGALDFALGLFAQPLPIEAGLSFREVYAPKFLCIARAGHPAIKGRLSLNRFCKLKHVATFYPGTGPGLIDRVLAERGLRRDVILSLPHWLSVPFVVAQSDLIATVPESIAIRMCDYLSLQRFKCPISFPQLRASLVWHLRTQESDAHRWFRDLVINCWK